MHDRVGFIFFPGLTMISPAFATSLIIMLSFCAATVYDGPCKDMKLYKESSVKKNDSSIGCISFEYRADDAEGFCKKYDERKIGVAEMSKFGEGNCVMEIDKIYCMCSRCDTQEIIDSLLLPENPTKEIAEDVKACKNLTTKPPNRSKKPPNRSKKEKINATVEDYYLEDEGPRIRRTTTTAEPTTTLDYEIPDKPDVKPSATMLKWYCALIENFDPPYRNEIPEVEKRSTQADERVGTSNTPSIIFSSRKQQELYGTNTLLLLIVNLIALLGIVVIFRAVLNATLHLLWPDYGLN